MWNGSCSSLPPEMSLRLEMLRAAEKAPEALGDSTPLVVNFLRSQISPQGAGLDRAGQPDLYYTIFALAGLQALGAEIPSDRVHGYLQSFGDGAGLDFVHLGALARCWAAIGSQYMVPGLPEAILQRIEKFRSADGGYDSDPGSSQGNAYGCFVALGAYQDLQGEQPEPLGMVKCLKGLETTDGVWANAPGLAIGSTNATAAAVMVLQQLGVHLEYHVADWLHARCHTQGGFLAMPAAPLPDLLSTATSLHALVSMEVILKGTLRNSCLEFLDTLWTNRGGFHGHWADEEIDAEYTFYGLLAMGHLV
jgi:prenyltransferase beta subunit